MIDLTKIGAIKQRFVDEDYLLRDSLIRDKNWKSIPIFDYINAEEALQLASASNKFGDMITIYFQYGDHPHIEINSASQFAIEAANLNHAHEYILMSSLNEDYLYYKIEDNEFFVIAGDPEFIEIACPYSKVDIIDKFENRIIMARSRSEVDYLRKIFQKYFIL